MPANDMVVVHRQANFLTCLEASARFRIAFDDGPETDFQKGLTFRPGQNFSTVRIVNNSGADMTVELGFGSGQVDDNRLVLQGDVAVKAISPDALTTQAPAAVPAGQAVELAGANTARAEIMVKNLSLSETIWIQGAATVAAHGLPLDGKEGVVLTVKGAVYAYNPAGVAVSVAVMETEALA
ncbi:hypothetical protein KBY28_07770 [Ruegeria pomeroyi]|nr:hypothetical protein [Ruegeria pomeroyi]